MTIKACSKAVISIFLITCIGCGAPHDPPEMGGVITQEDHLWRAGAPRYTPEAYERYRGAMRNIKDRIIREKGKFRWFRDYRSVEDRVWGLAKYGERILCRVERIKEERSESIGEEISQLKRDIAVMRRSVARMNEGSLARRGLTRAELMIEEARLLGERGLYDAAEEKLGQVAACLHKSRKSVDPVLSRYSDPKVLSWWKRLAEEAAAGSKKTGGAAIVVSKIDRRLTVYQKGNPVSTFEIGLGRNGLSRKLYAGDAATPEGRYSVIWKNPASRYYKALLIDYPNKEDKKRYALAQTNGLIPRNAGIGALVEIHGGGKGSVTNGCVSLDNTDMDRIFELVSEGTIVVIVGAVSKGQ